ncbi:MAG: hypothetical protein AAFX03_08685 [Pseudomonadota bacterium]
MLAPDDIWPQTIGALYADARAAGWSPRELERLLAVNDLVDPLFAGWRRASGRPFTAHLCGVAALALRYGGSQQDVLAGFGHAVFEGGAYGREGASPRRLASQLLADAAFEGARDLIEDYARFDWRDFIRRSEYDADAAVTSAPRRCVFLRIVNEMDDALDWPFLNETRRTAGTDELAASVGIADAFGWTKLADAASALRDCMAASQAVRTPGRDGAYFVTPPGYRRAAGPRLARLADRLVSSVSHRGGPGGRRR